MDAFWGCRTAWEWYGRLETGFGTFRTVPRVVGSWVGVGVPGFLFPDMGVVRYGISLRGFDGFRTTQLWYGTCFFWGGGDSVSRDCGGGK